MQTPSLQELLEAGVHFGHQVNRWHPNMAPFIYGSRDNIHIIDLLKTREQLVAACDYLKEQAQEGKVILFLGTKHQAQSIIAEEAEKAGMPYLTKRWIGGLITNWEQIRRNLERLTTYEKEKESQRYAHLTKKERLLLDRKMAKLNSELAGVKRLPKLPDIMFIVDPKKEINAVLEANKKDIPVVALCDTNTNPGLVAYPIPGNDDSIKSLRLIIGAVAQAIAEGKATFEKANKKTTDGAAEDTGEPVIANEDEVIKDVVEEVEGIVEEVEEKEVQQDASLVEEQMGSASDKKEPEGKDDVKKAKKTKAESEEAKADIKVKKTAKPKSVAKKSTKSKKPATTEGTE